ncbi:MAG: hypothetical protein DRQ60_07620 [Gammaproteobacteria bacterium]|nr:MAG: hypothetical protein DRQ54_00575 [Gammaproteobacteria bacterium]RLA13409.1 MAG: hypothetical protein DRQ60_07620 [Gammaproteobacteria bacterium]RLA16130.1 MAG: hypothetical protein DRQ52_00080 [Gammaproteobacteria bacterium]
MNTPSKLLEIQQKIIGLELNKIRRSAAETACRLQLEDDHFFIILPPGDTAYANCDITSLIIALTNIPADTKFNYWELTPRETSLSLEETRQGQKIILESLEWKITEFYSAGKPPTGIDLYADKVSLNHWPNFTGQSHSRDDSRIAALWITRPTSVVSTATTLQIDIKKINDFFACSMAAGLISLNPSETENLQYSTNPIEENRPRNRLPKRLASVFRDKH